MWLNRNGWNSKERKKNQELGIVRFDWAALNVIK